MSMLATMEQRVTDRELLHLTEGLSFQPVFIIGDHRSGTTMLYQWLAATGAFTPVTAYHVIRYDDILGDHVRGTVGDAKAALQATFAQRGLVNRIIDNVAVTPDLPEEYGFVIDGSPRSHVAPNTVDRLTELCRKLRYTGGDRPLLLKNPWDVLHFDYIKRAFPNARFIFVHRDPVAVINSQVRAVRSLLAERNDYLEMIAVWYRELLASPLRLRLVRTIYDAPGGLGVALARRHASRVADSFLRHVPAIPVSDHVTVRYEDLCAAPDATMRRIVDFAGVTPLNWPAYGDLAAPRRQQLLPEVESRKSAIYRSLKPYCDYAGYAA
jgi:Sulfotransferase family